VSVDKYRPQRSCWLQVWILNESFGKIESILKHDKDLKPLLRNQFHGTVQWILEDINYNMFLSSSYAEENIATSEDSIEWNSDEDVEEQDVVDHSYLQDNTNSVVEKRLEWNSIVHNALNNGETNEEYSSDDYDDIKILGFHPYKEIVFLSASVETGLAYHLNGSKMESLGNIYPKEYAHFKELPNEQEMIESFPYTPCWIEEFPLNS
jgi:hypothetical protein